MRQSIEQLHLNDDRPTECSRADLVTTVNLSTMSELTDVVNQAPKRNNQYSTTTTNNNGGGTTANIDNWFS
jgi:hypothetical protein